MTGRCRVVILGAGPAGLGAAYQLTRQTAADVTVLERQAGVGGNAGSFQLAGLNVDYGSHRLHPACDPLILQDVRRLLGNDLLDRPRRGRIRLGGRWLKFPLNPLNLAVRLPPGFALGAAGDTLKRLVRRSARGDVEPTFAAVLTAGLGPTICRDFYFPYCTKIWGMPPESISPVLARRRIRGSSPAKLLRKVLAAVPGFRRPGSGRFYYPRQGYGQISQEYYAAAKRQGAAFRLGATVNSVSLNSQQDGANPPQTDSWNRERSAGLGGHAAPATAWEVEYQAGETTQRLPADHVWSTIPVTSLLSLLSPPAAEDILQAAARIRFRAMILVYLVVEQPRFSEFDAHYFPDAQTNISRLSEPRNYSGVVEPPDTTVLCAELPCALDGHAWSLSDKQLAELVHDDLARNSIPLSAPVRQVVTRRLPYAYPIYELGFEQHFERIDRWLSEIPRLLSFGRQGLFAHDNTHHALAMAYAAVECLNADGDFDSARWRSYRLQFETHVVED